MSKFMGTPGPWFLDQYGNLKAEQGDCVRSMVGFSGLCLTNGRTAKANTQLVVAAPELLEALQYALETLKDCDMDLFHNVIEVGDAAIAKALGNQ